jgi:hypothetical protein
MHSQFENNVRNHATIESLEQLSFLVQHLQCSKYAMTHIPLNHQKKNHSKHLS